MGELPNVELATRVGVDDLGNAIASEGLLEDLAGMSDLQRDGHFMSQYAAKHSGTHEGALQVALVDAVHNPQGVVTVNHHFALSNPP
jgi:hypothetical protein